MPEISDTVAWYAALAFGAIIVGTFSWTRFDEPSYDDKSQFFRLYAPRFSTPSGRYWNARLGYVVVLITIFIFFSLFPKFLLVFVTGDSGTDLEGRSQGSALPLIVAMLLMGFQNVPGFKQLEVRIRSALHAVGKIPDGVRRTVNQLKGAQFNFDDYDAALRHEMTRLAGAADDHRLTPDLIKSDAVLRRWCKISCLLNRITDRGKRSTRISDSFFDTYDEELESITARHDALTLRVAAYTIEFIKSIPIDADRPIEGTASARGEVLGDAELVRELRKLRDRLFTFIACGLRSSVRSERQVSSALMDLGFDVRLQPKTSRGILGVAGLFLIAVVSITVFTVFVSMEFNGQYVAGQNWEDGLSRAILVPQEHVMLWLWTLFSAAFYLAAVVGALVPRAAAIAQLNWFDLDQDERQRPLSHYVGPIILGGMCGYLALCLMQVIIYFLTTSQPSGAGLLEHAIVGMGQSSYWIPLAVIISFFALWVSDAELRKTNWTRKLSRALVAALAMALVGWLISDMNSDLIANKILEGSEAPPEFEKAQSRANLMIAAFITLLTTLLLVLIQRQEHRVQKKENLAGKWLTLRSSDGGTCDIQLEPDGTVVHGGAGPQEAEVVGTWTQYPEGHVIKWKNPLQLGAYWLQGHGVLLREVDTIIFEEYTADLEREAEFVAQVMPKANGAPPSEPEPASVVPLRAA